MSAAKKAKTIHNGNGADSSAILASVKDYYGKVLSTSKDLKTSACCAAGKPHPALLEIFKKIPKEVTEKFYGCGSPLPFGIDGLRVLDLGSGSGRDCYAAAALVGEKGSVVGIDMTDEQLSVSRDHASEFCTKTLGYKTCNMSFIKGYIECLTDAGVKPGSFDIVISNCVVNLSPDKKAVINEVYRALAPGGEFFFSDVYCDRRLPEHVQKHEVLWGECLAGALYDKDFERYARAAGFADPRILSVAPIEVEDYELMKVVGQAKFYSITYRLFKLPNLLETLCEDYGQAVKYKGTIPGSEDAYRLDAGHLFEKNKLSLVCGNSAAMCGEDGLCWLSKHFEIIGDRKVHYGLFPCGAKDGSIQVTDSGPGGCC
mmetsp:Transcript_29289/g.74227  ORF Transcript_29289/g.74227 Transcript_29289/m.74227 type:complete len:372 (+) Transcript_29289:63-1178(+)